LCWACSFEDRIGMGFFFKPWSLKDHIAIVLFNLVLKDFIVIGSFYPGLRKFISWCFFFSPWSLEGHMVMGFFA
jgi:hypothetical protein